MPLPFTKFSSVVQHFRENTTSPFTPYCSHYRRQSPVIGIHLFHNCQLPFLPGLFLFLFATVNFVESCPILSFYSHRRLSTLKTTTTNKTGEHLGGGTGVKQLNRKLFCFYFTLCFLSAFYFSSVSSLFSNSKKVKWMTAGGYWNCFCIQNNKENTAVCWAERC